MAFVNFIKPEISFKRVSGGWLFRAPNPWILGDAPHYLVDDDHRVRIIAAIRTTAAVAPLAVIIASIAGVSLAVFWELGDIGVLVLIVVLALVAISSLAAIQRLRLEPILMDAPLTNEQITYAEMRKADEDSTPPEQARWRWLRSAGMCVLAAFLVIFDWAAGRQGGMMVFTFLCLYSGWQVIRWYRVHTRRAKQER